MAETENHAPALPEQEPTTLVTGRIDQMINRAWQLRWRAPLRSRRSAQQAHQIASLSGQAEAAFLQGRAARVMGWHKRWTGQFAAARDYFLEAEQLLCTPAFKSQRIEAMAGRAVVLYSQGKQDEASELIRSALRLLGPDGSASTRVDLFLVQATILSYSRAFDDALTLVDEAISLARASGALAELSHAIHIRARISLRMLDTDAARQPAEEAVTLAEDCRNAVILPYALEVLAAVEFELGNYERTTTLARRSADLGAAQDDRRVVCQALEVTGKALRQQGNMDAALRNQEWGLQIATEIEYPLWQRWFQLEIATIQEEVGDFRAALAAYKAYSQLDQDLFRKETETRMAEMRTKFDLQRAQELAEVERNRAAELSKAHEKAEISARTDQLTRIANRAGLERYVAANITDQPDREFAYVIVDIDRFKPINDTFGHAAGDAVLVEIAARLGRVIRKSDLVARIGGDEFAIIAQCITTPKEAAQLGERILAAFRNPITLTDRIMDISSSIGIAISNTVSDDLDELMSAADKAMYSSKNDSAPSFTVFDPLHFGESVNLNTMEQLRDAIRSGAIQPWFQPKIDLRSGRVVGFETLARWVSANGTVLTAGAFMPQVKLHKLNSEFTFSILRRTFQIVERWQRAGLKVPRIAINMVEELLASAEAREDIDLMLQEYASCRCLITFEITEDVFFDRGADGIRDSIAQLSGKGIRFAMDDFGTGYGSFTHLQQLHIHELKIDTSFVRGIGIDRAAEVIIEGFIFIAKGLQLEVTAEGIETDEQAAFLLARGCEIGQGFLFDQALPPEKAQKYLTSERRCIG